MSLGCLYCGCEVGVVLEWWCVVLLRDVWCIHMVGRLEVVLESLGGGARVFGVLGYVCV